MLGPYLRSLRTANGISAADALRSLGVPRSTLYSWEGPISRPDPVQLGRMLDLYGASEIQRAEAWRLRAHMGDEPSSAPAAQPASSLATAGAGAGDLDADGVR